MDFSFLTPVSSQVISDFKSTTNKCIGQTIQVYSDADYPLDLSQVRIAIIAVKDNRCNTITSDVIPNFDSLRLALYNLFPGNWNLEIADLGDIEQGNTVSDTYFALQTCVNFLLKSSIIPIIIGGSQDLTFANYRAYDTVLPMINIVNVDTNFDLGDADSPITNTNFLGKIIVDTPYNLFNYTTIGYQTYFNTQSEISLMEQLYFEAYRLGDISADINGVEPLMRDANLVTVDLKAIKASEIKIHNHFSPNGFTGKEMCAISRYAGISNKVSSFGIYDIETYSNNPQSAALVSQMIWYFIEGVHQRVFDNDFSQTHAFKKFNVTIDRDILVFYKSTKSNRWWVEIPFLEKANNKLKKHTLLPCNYNDYLQAVDGHLPERWYKACKKNSL